ncbi:unnamed protein product, partial [Staurois parvus]
MTVAVSTGEECGGYYSGQYVQESRVAGMTGGSMYRKEVWRVWRWAVCTGEECGGYDSGQYVEEEECGGYNSEQYVQERS